MTTQHEALDPFHSSLVLELPSVKSPVADLIVVTRSAGLSSGQEQLGLHAASENKTRGSVASAHGTLLAYVQFFQRMDQQV